MVRKHFLLPQELVDWLNTESKENGFTVSEIVRWILNKEKATQESQVSASQSKKGGK